MPPPAPPNTAPPLPYHSPSTNIRIVSAIIHVLPGYYGAGNFGQHNGLTPNGETFPIYLPPNVSIRGSSALDVVFDLSGEGTNGRGPVFVFGVNVSAPGWNGRQFDINGQGTFIDKVSFVGASDVQVPFQRGAAVALREDVGSSPTITNCFFFKNLVGVAVAGSFTQPPIVHQPTIVNCTFADNYIGLWNGQYDPLTPLRAGVGISPLLLLNNIFDGMPLGCDGQRVPGWPSSWGTATSDFEGVSLEDLFVGPPNPWPGNYNAYNFADNLAHYNYGVQILPNYPATTYSMSAAIPPATNLNLAPYTGWGATIAQRGVLFVRDLLCNGPVAAPSQFPMNPLGQWDGSPMDFRLSPSVALASNIGPLPPAILNPLVDAGYGDNSPLTAPITMLNGRSLSAPPGYIALLGGSQATWPYSCWTKDCEGYGNRRFHDHLVYSNATSTPQAGDIGADEVDDHIRAGMRAMTSSFLADFTLASNADNKYFFYLGPANMSAGGRLPDSRAFPVAPPPGYNPVYTRVISGVAHTPWADTWTYTPTTPYYYPTRVDVMPHLLPDLHPWWLALPIGSPSLCVWQHCLGFPYYNPLLFVNPTADVIHPPGAGAGFAPAYEWLDGFNPGIGVNMTPFGPWGTGPANISQFSTWCLGTDSTASAFFDTLPRTGMTSADNVGLRFSTEFAGTSLFGSQDTNLQTHHVFVREQ
jgi:hypothetical protein